MMKLLEKDLIAPDSIYSAQQLAQLSSKDIPTHVAVIMDGNRRWASKNDLPAEMGHIKGAEVLKSIVHSSMELKIGILTVFAFSTENWKRPDHEVHQLMDLFENYLHQERNTMLVHNIRFSVIGDQASLSDSLRQLIQDIEFETSSATGLHLIVALNYGSRNEIAQAAKKLVSDCLDGKIALGHINEKLFSSYLSTSNVPDPDLVIRTGGECRLSNFLLWQSAYADIFTSLLLWPEYSPSEFLNAIKIYTKREKRRGS